MVNKQSLNEQTYTSYEDLKSPPPVNATATVELGSNLQGIFLHVSLMCIFQQKQSVKCHDSLGSITTIGQTKIG